MKKLLTFAIATVAFFATAMAQQATEPIKWTTKSHDFGTIKMGPKAETTFAFTNTSTVPVVITQAKPSCGCTTPSYTSTPIMPGETGEIKASYGTEGRPGQFDKTITVTFDAFPDKPVVLSIHGNVTTEGNSAGSDL
ncbi:MAG: DUF1573 domain-containing protein [Bacteroidetes bacterium]|jgi:hypothetical protein|nr:DUF1573 domain-containing protein [Bacteroidota bacterium]MDA0942934.1 DUF1573 domain-containing protein [Bacteroidota bacterium]MDA1110992.1 DUF1573 domain-containing protein [Bacteroidota bacterium]